MAVPETVRDAQSLVDYAKSLDCIHCGLCLDTCPTYRLTGVESSSPRGRIHLMRAVAEGELEPDLDYKGELDFCLVCRHCESVCPAGVRFGQMMEFARDALPARVQHSRLARFARFLGFRVILPSRALLRLAGSLLGIAQRTGVVNLTSRLLGERGESLRYLPLVPPGAERRLLPRCIPARPLEGSAPSASDSEQRDALRDEASRPNERREDATRKGTYPVDAKPRSTPVPQALLLEGCVMPELFARVNRATAAALSALGTECHTARDAVCCGALHAHNGDLAGARALAKRTIAAFEEAARAATSASPESLPLVVNSAGCGAHLSELEHLFPDDPEWRERARAFSARVVDFSEYALARLEATGARPRLPHSSKATWDAPCHLCHGQGVRKEPLAILDRIGGLERVELEGSESCCGSAGIYSLLRPKDANAILDPKLDALEQSGASLLVTANPGCQLQWETGIRRRGLPVRVAHLAEVLANALGPRDS